MTSPDHAPWLRRLLPHAVHHETQLSHVFITGTDVFKLKKPVNLPFADYSTIEARRRGCARELDVNKAFAPELYRGMVPLTLDAGTPSIGGGGEVIDWLVHMHPFREEDRADRMLADGRLTPELLTGFVDRLYAQHTETGKRPGGSWPETLGRLATDAAQALSDNLPQGDDGPKEWLARFLARADALAPELEARGALGVLETCHGDLHLKNLCLWKGRLVAYDALEFDPDLVRIDPLYDLAFLVADLVHRRAAAEANGIMGRYLGLARAAEGVLVIPLYGSLRAVIRAMASAGAGKREEAAGYLETAERFLEPVEKAQVVVVSGRSGTGKTTLAAQLAPRIGPPPGALIVRSDVVRKRLSGRLPEERLGPGDYGDDRNAEVYAALEEAAVRLKGRWPLILDVALAGSRAGGDLLEVADVKLWLTASDDVLVERLEARKGDASDATPAVMRGQNADPPSEGFVVIDTEAGLDAAVEDAFGAIHNLPAYP